MNVRVSSDSYGRTPDKCSCPSVYLHIHKYVLDYKISFAYLYNIYDYICYSFLYNML